ncbi:circadian-associated transcriptional repressor-like [Triplophysa rosa]|uniref:Circadian transcriptional repressor C1orf51-like n=1 Tax=Triplophysa rosa TaxID=992332 RepID=A0A9W8C4F3_TRIRA|nr:circadian-associated transcriptional repressor-like [Triplophysa rosa]KAI7806968.1 putative circadian transcriptional repressor C1orf51-like [Triplophysa rosa]
MQSPGRTSSQPSQDLLSSNDSILFSDRDVFQLEDESCETRSAQSIHSNRSVYSVDGETTISGSQWACDGFSESSDPKRSKEGKAKERTEGDILFARKCLELQGFVRPLLELLNGLKKGRFDKGLSSFQQSVAMDRIQRIVGVLQKPHIGEKYLPTLMQIEVMLKLWFPQVTPQVSSTPNPADLSPRDISIQSSSNTTPPHKHKDQLHIPVKKRRLSWSDTDTPSSSPPAVCKRSNVKGCEEQLQWPYFDGGEGSSGTPPPSSQTNQSERRQGETSKHKILQWSGSNLTWVHVAPIFSPPKSGPSHKGGAKERGSSYVLLTSRSSPATQDSSISSTTPFSEPAGSPCKHVTSGTASALQGRVQTPPITVKPSCLVQQSPLQA